MDIAGPSGLDPQDLEGQFDTISRLMYAISGVHLSDRKRDLVKSRLGKRLRELGWTSLREYVRFVQTADGKRELARMVDSLTTNKTDFFRESAHFDFVRDHILPGYRESGKPLSVWSAGCSSGEEPYTLAIVLSEGLPNPARRQDRILATDISREVLAKAKAGVYAESRMEGVSESVAGKWFLRRVDPETGGFAYEIAPALRALVTVAHLNLMERWPMRGPFDFIFCRNVMIYFDRQTRARLVERFTDILAPGGYLFVGHSESLTSLSHGLRYVQPAVYRK